jgi:ribonucleoside-diphosphate reductase alpha chain
MATQIIADIEDEGKSNGQSTDPCVQGESGAGLELNELGQKIFLDRYALKDICKRTLSVGDTVIVCADVKTGQREIGVVQAINNNHVTVELRDGSTLDCLTEHVSKPIETEPEQMIERVARGIAAVEGKQADEWYEKFRWLLSGWKFVPAGRILAAAGTDQQLTFYNCMPPEQQILTADGYKPIAEVKVGEAVVTHRNRLRRVLHKFERETEEPLYILRAGSLGYGDLRLTGDHKVLAIRISGARASSDRVKFKQGPQWIPAKELKPGDLIAAPYDGKQSYTMSATRISGYAEYDELWWVEIEQITTIDYRGRVLDIEVEEDHSFISAGMVVSNCYVIPSPKDSRRGIVETLSQMMEIMSRGGGVGINISSLRPRHSYVKGVNGRSSGSVSWGALYSFVTGLIEQGGSRRGALMLILNCWHPDVLEFINSKREMGKITNANISVGVTDKFMEAVEADADWDLVFPDTSDPDYEMVWDGNLEKWLAAGKKTVVHKTVKAREVWNAIIESAWASAEPGVFFIERANKMSNSWYYDSGYLGCTNPCVTGDTLVAVEQGYIRARDLREGMKIRTPAGPRPIEKVFNNGVQFIYQVEFSDGGYLRCTADHKLKVVRDKRYVWIPASELRQGDRVLVAANESFGPRRELPAEALEYIEKRELNISNCYDRNLGLVVGVVLGGGSFRKGDDRNSHSYHCYVSFSSHEQAWLDRFVSLMERMNIHTHGALVEKQISRGDGTVIVHRAVRLECYKLAALLAKIGLEPNFIEPQKALPVEFLSLDKEFLAGVLDGLFSTDGSVLVKQDNPQLRFQTSSHELAQQVRLILLQFGIHGHIYRAERETDLMHGTGHKYDVVVMNEGISRFYSEIGLSHPEKAERLKEIAENWHGIGGTWTASVVSVRQTQQQEEVYDVYEPSTLTWVTNGYVSFDCGEQPLPGWGVCNLGAINLSKFVRDGRVAWDDLGKVVRYAVRFLDDVIDATPYFFEENYRQQKSERRVGLNTMGLAEMLIRLGIRYGSDESTRFIDRLYCFIATQAYLASADIAAEKGPFAMFDAEKFLQSGYMQGMPEEVRRAVRQKGLRNVTLLTQAPNGTIGTMVGTSTGIEPFYFWSYFRKSRLGQHEERVKVFEEWQQAHPGEPLPDYFVTAMDLAPEEHVKVQAAIQRWVDSSISKTCNLPNSYTVEQTRQIYELLYKLGCKGGTIYRDGSRDTQVLNLKEEDKKVSLAARKPGANAVCDTYQDDTDASIETVLGPDTTPAHPKVRPRPYKRHGCTVSKATPSGTAHITMNDDEQGQPFEVFVEIGKAGSDIKAMAEAMGRLMSLILRMASPVSPVERVREIVKQITGIGGARSYGFGKRRVLSLPDAVGQALAENYLGVSYGGQESEGAPAGGSTRSAKPAAPADLCPNCGDAAFVRAEGCQTCYACGYSEC